MKNNNCSIRYILVAQNRRDELVIQIAGKKQYFLRKAQDIINTPDLLAGFSSQHLALINYIVQRDK